MKPSEYWVMRIAYELMREMIDKCLKFNRFVGG